MLKRRLQRPRLSLHLSKCQIVGNLMPRLNYIIVIHILVIQCQVSTSGQKAAELISNQFENTTSEAIWEWEDK